jgi:hypothetical protein
VFLEGKQSSSWKRESFGGKFVSIKNAWKGNVEKFRMFRDRRLSSDIT